MCTRVLIADDQPRARRSLKALLTAMRWSTPNPTEPSTHADRFPLEIVGEAQDGQEAVEQVWALHPDVVLMDLQMHTVFAPEPRLNGLATIQMLKRQWPAIRVVVLTMYATDRAVRSDRRGRRFSAQGLSYERTIGRGDTRRADAPQLNPRGTRQDKRR